MVVRWRAMEGDSLGGSWQAKSGSWEVLTWELMRDPISTPLWQTWTNLLPRPSELFAEGLLEERPFPNLGLFSRARSWWI